MSQSYNQNCKKHLYSFVYPYLTGEAIVAFATVTESNTEDDDELLKELRTLVRAEIGPFAAPDVICITPSLPMVGSTFCSSFNKLSLQSFYSHHCVSQLNHNSRQEVER